MNKKCSIAKKENISTLFFIFIGLIFMPLIGCEGDSINHVEEGVSTAVAPQKGKRPELVPHRGPSVFISTPQCSLWCAIMVVGIYGHRCLSQGAHDEVSSDHRCRCRRLASGCSGRPIVTNRPTDDRCWARRCATGNRSDASSSSQYERLFAPAQRVPW